MEVDGRYSDYDEKIHVAYYNDRSNRFRNQWEDMDGTGEGSQVY